MKKKTHFLDWHRYRMACGKKPQEVWGVSSRWSKVTCRKCLKREALGSVEA